MLDDVRVEVAFDADPMTTTPAFRDLSSRARLDAGITISRGRLDQYEAVQPGSCTLAFDNDDGALTPGYAGAVLRTNLCTNPSIEVNTTGYTPTNATLVRDNPAGFGAQGAWSLRVVPTGASTSSYASLVPSGGWGPLVGQQVTVSAWVYTGTAQGGATDALARRIVSLSRVAAEPYTVTQSAAGTNGPVAGGERVSMTFTVLSADTVLRLYNGSATTDAKWVHWDGVLVEAGVDLRDYFDGDTADTAGIDYRWTGTSGLSSSQQWRVAIYANLKAQNRIRVSYRDPAVPGNLLDAESAGFEGGTVGGWTGTSGAAVASSTTRAFSGTRSLLVTWPTAAANGSSARWATTPEFVIGRQYTVRARVWVPAGHPPVRIAFVSQTFPFYGAQTSTTGAWEWISSTFTAGSNEVVIVIRANAATTAGQQVWVDEVRIDEAAAPATFTTSPMVSGAVGGVVKYRFDGFVHEWPTAWPKGGQESAVSTVTAYDLASRLARTRQLTSVIEETWRLSSPSWYFPLDESEGATSVGDRIGTGATLAPTQLGTGGELVFGGATGPPTDGRSAPKFTPASATDGLYLTGRVPQAGWAWITTGISLEATINTTTSGRVIARLTDPWGTYLELSVTNTGTIRATFADSWTTAVSVTSPLSYADGRTHTVALTFTGVGTALTLRLYVDGVERGTPGNITTWVFLPGLSHLLYVGGRPGGDLFSGTISHVAVFGSTLSAGTLADHHTAASTGFAGERTDQRIARVLDWVGVPSTFRSLDVGKALAGHIDPTGKDPWAFLGILSTTEAGAVFAGADGRLTFHARTRSYDTAAAAAVTVDADSLDPSTMLRHSVEDLVNSAVVTRADGATVRAMNAASVATYGTFEKSVEIASATDADVFDRANWLVNERSQPRTLLPELALDALSGSAAARGLDLGGRVLVTSMPAQSATSTFDLRAQGYTETISRGGWVVRVNATPFLLLPPLILDDPVYGVLDSTNRIVY
ncbi:LamG-like jellyroll fold domain-containing protein [Oryzobacter sp. R7]|uniref:LamG-like jellyroll fold domain-containing protein n=1 Tax=Oryzobacter faecalis TaxID=3388656 RepID=UPI00398CCA22